MRYSSITMIFVMRRTKVIGREYVQCISILRRCVLKTLFSRCQSSTRLHFILCQVIGSNKLNLNVFSFHEATVQLLFCKKKRASYLWLSFEYMVTCSLLNFSLSVNYPVAYVYSTFYSPRKLKFSLVLFNVQ